MRGMKAQLLLGKKLRCSATLEFLDSIKVQRRPLP